MADRNHCGFVAGGADLGAVAGLAGASAPAGAASVADLIESSFGKFFAVGNRIIFQVRVFQGSGDRRVRADAELDHEAWDHAEKAGAVIEMMLDEVIETVGADRGPGASHCDGEISARGDELHLEGLWRFVLEERRTQQGTIVGAGCWRTGLRRGGRLGLCGGLRRSLRRSLCDDSKDSSEKQNCEFSHVVSLSHPQLSLQKTVAYFRGCTFS